MGFTDADDLRRWVQTVAWRVAIDESRRLSRHDDADNVVDLASFQEVPVEVEHRLLLAATSKAWRALSAADRKAIVAESNEYVGLTRKEAVRLNVRRHRARARLLALVEGVAAFVVVSYRRVRRLPAVTALAMVLPISALLLPFVDRAPGGDGATTAKGGATPNDVVSVKLADAHTASTTGGEPQLVPSPDDAPPSSDATDGRAKRAPSALDFDTRLDTPIEDSKDPYLYSEPKEPGEPLACATTPATPRTCTPPLPVEVPAPPQPPGVDL